MMRIVAGTHRGRKLLGPRDQTTTRPITDRVKTSLFDRLWSMGLLNEADDALVLDVFSGTGTLGLEALSRGAGRCVFIEQDRDALDRLKRNLETLGLADRARVMRVNALHRGWVRLVEEKEAAKVQVAFVDPPYALLRRAEGPGQIAALVEELRSVMEPGGVVVLRLEKQVAPLTVPGFEEPQSHTYGGMTLHFYRPVGE